MLRLFVLLSLIFVWCSASSLLYSRIHELVATCSVDDLRVTLRVFSGTADPAWSLSSHHLADLLQQLNNRHRLTETRIDDTLNITARVLGYQAFVLSCRNSSRGVVVRQQPSLELLLLRSGIASGPLSKLPQVVSHVKSRIGERGAVSDEDLSYVGGVDGGFVSHLGGRVLVADGVCKQWCPLRGPDTPPQYNPDTDDKGCFESDQILNNCYAYATDIVTDTFPQPGRGSGHKFTNHTCSDIGPASERDGLVYYGTELPTAQPPHGHYAALFTWPDNNYHWIRKDADAPYWSHKPGIAPVRNTDNTGALITDPSKSDFSPWTQFCAYYLAVPSNLTIN